MLIDPAAISGQAAYGWLIDTVQPRPVAWITTVQPDGATNLAPFSFFNGVCARPPIVSVSIIAKAVGDPRRFEPKDTAANIARTGEFVVHLATAGDAATVLSSSEHWPAGTDVPAELGLEVVAGSHVAVPRLVGAPVAMECRLESITEVGEPAASLVLGRVLAWHVDEEILGEDGRPRSTRWDPLARLGVEGFAPPRADLSGG